MSHPVDCPAWDYENFPGWDATVLARCIALLRDLHRRQTNTRAAARDTRAAHGITFRGLVPPACGYFAGNYRGAKFRCLQFYVVGIASDPRVGAPPAEVWALMNELDREVATGFGALDAASALPNAQVSQRDKLVNVVAFACRLFEVFLRIHPYANGNGHMARYVLVCVLARYGYFLRRFPLEPRPPDPGYTDAIVSYRNGNPEDLEAFVLGAL